MPPSARAAVRLGQLQTCQIHSSGRIFFLFPGSLGVLWIWRVCSCIYLPRAPLFSFTRMTPASRGPLSRSQATVQTGTPGSKANRGNLTGSCWSLLPIPKGVNTLANYSSEVVSCILLFLKETIKGIFFCIEDGWSISMLEWNVLLNRIRFKVESRGFINVCVELHLYPVIVKNSVSGS